MEKQVREILISAIEDQTAVIEEIYLFHHWVVIKSGRYEMSTRFSPGLDTTEDTQNTWLGDLIGQNTAKIAKEYLASTDVLSIAVGMACYKCIIPEITDYFENSAMDHFSEQIKTMPSCFIGHFHDAAKLREDGYPVNIIELKPREGDIHWDDSHEILYKATLVFMTGLTLVNNTFGEVIKRTPYAKHRIIMGPTVPLTPALFRLGLDWLGTSRIVGVKKTLQYFGMGGGSVMYAPHGALQKVNIGMMD